MSLTNREFLTLLHGMLVGGLFLVSYTGGMVGLLGLRADNLTVDGISRQSRLVGMWTSVMAVVAWLTVLLGTYIVYPWYRAKAPKGANLLDFPQAALMAEPSRAGWHNFGMEWKEHVGWFTPILATTAAYLVWRYGAELSRRPDLRRLCISMLSLAFATALAAGLFGALITKAAPVR